MGYGPFLGPPDILSGQMSEPTVEKGVPHLITLHSNKLCLYGAASKGRTEGVQKPSGMRQTQIKK